MESTAASPPFRYERAGQAQDHRIYRELLQPYPEAGATWPSVAGRLQSAIPCNAEGRLSRWALRFASDMMPHRAGGNTRAGHSQRNILELHTQRGNRCAHPAPYRLVKSFKHLPGTVQRNRRRTRFMRCTGSAARWVQMMVSHTSFSLCACITRQLAHHQGLGDVINAMAAPLLGQHRRAKTQLRTHLDDLPIKGFHLISDRLPR